MTLIGAFQATLYCEDCTRDLQHLMRRRVEPATAIRDHDRRRSETMRATITHARIARGYSGYDHLLDDGPLHGMVGQTYPSLRAAAIEASARLEGTQDRRCASAPVVLMDEHGDGGIYWGDGR